MQFTVIARDEPGAASRRAELRDAHVARAERLKAAGNLLYGVALMDKRGGVCGSVMVFEFESRADLDRWLEQEPYVTGRVWGTVEVTDCRVGPMFTAR